MISNNPHYLSGRKKFEAKDFAGALNEYNEALKAEENPSIYSERGVVWYYLGDKDVWELCSVLSHGHSMYAYPWGL